MGRVDAERDTWEGQAGRDASAADKPSLAPGGSQADTCNYAAPYRALLDPWGFFRVRVSGEDGNCALNAPLLERARSLEWTGAGGGVGWRLIPKGFLVTAVSLCCSSKEHLISKEISVFPRKGACWRGEFLGPTQDLLNQKLGVGVGGPASWV